MTTFSKQLKALREGKNWTHFDLSMKCGIREQSLRRYEQGQCPRTADTYVLLADVLGTDLETLMGKKRDVA